VTRLAVLGSPIGHSKSPLLHRAAYRELGLDWTYDAVEMTGVTLAEFVAGRDASWRGLSLTMPLKHDVMPLLHTADATAQLTGVANTLLFDRSARSDSPDGAVRLRGFNTDVYGVTRAFRDAGVERLDDVWILGGGATAASVIVAVRELGAARATVLVRDPARASGVAALGASVGLDLEVLAFGAGLPGDAPDAVVSTLPGHSEHGLLFPSAVRRSSVLFDVAYDPWPSTLAGAWGDGGGTVISGLGMLLHQALAQVRVFVNGTPDAPLDDEAAVLAAMREAVAR